MQELAFRTPLFDLVLAAHSLAAARGYAPLNLRGLSRCPKFAAHSFLFLVLS